MTHKKMYLHWLISVPIALSIAILFYLISMRVQYGQYSTNEMFGNLLSVIGSILVFLIGTGIIAAALIWIDDAKAKSLALRIAAYHIYVTAFCVGGFLIGPLLIGPLTLLFYFLVPWVAWERTIKKKNLKSELMLASIVICSTLALGAALFLSIVFFDPYR